MLSPRDLEQLKTDDISEELINIQLNHFKNGFAFSSLAKAATINDGIISPNKELEQQYIEQYEEALAKGLSVIKFVPASGAATRMFKSLFEFIQASSNEKEALLSKEPYHTFFSRLDDFAFVDELEKSINQKIDPKNIDANLGKTIIEHLLLPIGLNYGKLPKGLLKFHEDENATFTPLEEHLKETAEYAGCKKQGKVHFTVSPEHHALFNTQLNKSQADLEKKFDMKYLVDFSFQKKSTNTIAVNPDNSPFRQADDSLLFRPAGHGALIENLNELNEDLIFIKNIDNVVPEHLMADTVRNKKLLAGILINKKEKIFNILDDVQNKLTEGVDFLCEELQMQRDDIEKLGDEEKATLIKHKLNRPIRVCGMVKNEGEPGGGPFWVKQKDGNVSLQIVEGAQIDPNDEAQQAILKASTHFNPVDLVCYTKDYKGNKFDLSHYVDPETGFISEKTQNGKSLKALELPGLWNGAMAHWLTFFVEVPVSTFNPVKTVMDLLRPQHQPAK